MKLSKLVLLMWVLVQCVPAVFAQKQLKYVPGAVKGIGVVPLVINPQLPPMLRANFTVPVQRISPALTRAVTGKAVPQERIARLEANLRRLEEFARNHDNQLPPTYPNAQGAGVRQQVIKDIIFLKSRQMLPKDHPLFERYEQLFKAQRPQITTQQRIERLETNLTRLEEFVRTHDHKLPLTSTADEGGELRRQVLYDITSLKGNGLEKHPLFQRYKQLLKETRPQQPSVQVYVARLERNLNELEEFVRTHNNKLPQTYQGAEGSDIRNQVIADVVFLKKYKFLGRHHPLLQRYNRLVELHQQQLEWEKRQEHIIFAQQQLQERTARLQANLDELEEFARTHDHKLPAAYFDTVHSGLRKQIIDDMAYLKSRGIKEHALFQRHEQLLQAHKQQLKQEQKDAADKQRIQSKQRAEDFRQQKKEYEQQKREELARQEEAWEEELAYEQQREEELAEFDTITDSDAMVVAEMAERHLLPEGNITTEDYVEKLLNFYNKISPYGESVNLGFVSHSSASKIKLLKQIIHYRQEHNGENPPRYSADEDTKRLRWAWDTVYQRYKNRPQEQLNDDAIRALVRLHRNTIQEWTPDRTPQEILEQIMHYRQEHNGENPSRYSSDKEIASLRLAWNSVYYKYKNVPVEEIPDEAARELVLLYRQTVRLLSK